MKKRKQVISSEIVRRLIKKEEEKGGEDKDNQRKKFEIRVNSPTSNRLSRIASQTQLQNLVNIEKKNALSK